MRWWIEGEPGPLLKRLTEDLDATVGGPGSMARGRMGRKRFYRVSDGDEAYFVKVFAAPTGVARLASWLRPSKARRESAIAKQVEARGFAVAGPTAVGEERRLGLLRRSVSIVRQLPLTDLKAQLQEPDIDAGRRRALVESFGALTRRMHESGIDQDDPMPNNFLVDDDLGWVLIDFERCRLGAPVGERRYTLIAKLHRLDLGVTRSDRLRFLRAYLGRDERAARREAWARIEPEFLRVRKNDARRAARTAFRVGRHVGRDDDGLFVRGRENADVVRLAVDPAQCRVIWTLAHVFERLALPALRPVRLGAGHVDLLAPEVDEHALEFHAAVSQARRRFDPYGRWVRDPQWALTSTGAVLLTPNAFKLEL